MLIDNCTFSEIGAYKVAFMLVRGTTTYTNTDKITVTFQDCEFTDNIGAIGIKAEESAVIYL